MFFLKRKKIIVDTFTFHAGIHEASPISASKEFLPDWWKKYPSSVEEVSAFGLAKRKSTIKRCDGLLDNFRAGFVVPMWSDLLLKVEESGRYSYEFASEGAEITLHNMNQFGNLLDKFAVLKIVSPWIIKETDDVKFSFIQPMWSQLDLLPDVIIPPGVMGFKYQNTMNINMLVSKNNKQHHFPFNHPLVHLIPLSDKEVVINNHLVSQEEYQKIKQSTHKPMFMGSYKNRKKGCPFGFGK